MGEAEGVVVVISIEVDKQELLRNKCVNRIFLFSVEY